jgi:hypothetical protein
MTKFYPRFEYRKVLELLESIKQNKANKTRLGNRWGCSVGHVFRNFNEPSRLKASPRPSGASA